MTGVTTLKRRQEPIDDERGITPEREAKSEGHSEWGHDERGQKTLRTMRDSPIERALARMVITQKQYDAAIKFRLHWKRGGMAGSLQTLDPNHIFATDITNFSHMAKSEAEAHHRQQYRAAEKELGTIWAAILEQLICNEESFERVINACGFAFGGKSQQALERTLRDALNKLVKLWGI